MGFGGYGRGAQNDASLANMSQAHLVALGQQGNASHEQLLEMQAVTRYETAAEKQNKVPRSILSEQTSDQEKPVNRTSLG